MNRPDDEIKKGSITEQKIEIEENCVRTNYEQFMGVRFCTPFFGFTSPFRAYLHISEWSLLEITDGIGSIFILLKNPTKFRTGRPTILSCR